MNENKHRILLESAMQEISVAISQVTDLRHEINETDRLYLKELELRLMQLSSGLNYHGISQIAPF